MSTARFVLRTCCWTAAAMLMLGCVCIAADFSADTVMSGGGRQMMGKVYVSGNNLRQEMSMGAMKQVTIVRTDKSLAWIINPMKKQYSEIKDARIGGQNLRGDANLLQMGGKKKVVGKEKAGGFMCEKTQYTSAARPGAKIIRWYSKDLNWPVKTEMNMGPGKTQTEEMKNVKVGKQSASLFEVPKGYKKVTMQVPKMPAGHAGTKKPVAPKK